MQRHNRRTAQKSLQYVQALSSAVATVGAVIRRYSGCNKRQTSFAAVNKVQLTVVTLQQQTCHLLAFASSCRTLSPNKRHQSDCKLFQRHPSCYWHDEYIILMKLLGCTPVQRRASCFNTCTHAMYVLRNNACHCTNVLLILEMKEDEK